MKIHQKKTPKDIFFASFALGIRETFIILYNNDDGIEQHSLCLSCDFDKHLLLLPYSRTSTASAKTISSRCLLLRVSFRAGALPQRAERYRFFLPSYQLTASIGFFVCCLVLFFYFLAAFEYLVLMECLTRNTEIDTCTTYDNK
jgi:hypothetical protein